MGHYDSIKKLFPADLGEMSDADMRIEGEQLDDFYDTIMIALREAFPSTAISTLTKWENEFGIYKKRESVSDRRTSIISRFRELAASEDGCLSKDMFKSIADALGYDIEITEAGMPFRADISKAGDKVYDIRSIWVANVDVNATSAPELEELFEDLFPPYVKLEFNYI